MELIKSRWALDSMPSFRVPSFVGDQSTLAEIHTDYGNAHVCGKTRSIANERSISLPLGPHLVAKLMAVGKL